jgi:hypothetical protein
MASKKVDLGDRSNVIREQPQVPRPTRIISDPRGPKTPEQPKIPSKPAGAPPKKG